MRHAGIGLFLSENVRERNSANREFEINIIKGTSGENE